MSDRIALIIANNEFDDPKFSRLVSPTRDAESLENVLGDPEVGGFQTIPLINETHQVIRNQIDRLYLRRKRDSLLLLYYSGHGLKDAFGDLYLAAKDTQDETISSTTIEAAYIRRQIDKSQSRRKVVILDCCHSGAFPSGGAKASIDSSVGINEIISGSGYGRVILTASNALQYAWEGEKIFGRGSKSVFTHFLVEGLQTGAADANKDGVITLDELYDYAYDRVMSSGATQQIPQKWTQKVEGQIVIAQSKFQIPPMAELPEALQLAIESPFAGVREGAVKELLRLLSGKDEQMAAAARLSLEKLREDDSRSVSKAAAKALDSAIPAPAPPIVQSAKPAPREALPPPELRLKLSCIPDPAEEVEDVRWTLSMNNDSVEELVQVEVRHGDKLLRKPFTLPPGRWRRLSFITYYPNPGDYTETVQIRASTHTGSTVNYEKSGGIVIHPAEPAALLTGEIDLSGRIEYTTQATVLAFADGINYSVFISGAEKKATFEALKKYKPGRSALKLRIMIYTALLYLLLSEHATKLVSVQIDNEYKGHERAIKQQLLNWFPYRRLTIDPSSIGFTRLNRKSPAYKLAKKVFQGGIEPDQRIKKEDILALALK